MRAFGSASNAHIAARSFMADRNYKRRYRYYRRVRAYRHRGYEPYRPEAAITQVFAAIFAAAGASSRGASRHHRLGTVPRAQRHILGAKIRA